MTAMTAMTETGAKPTRATAEEQWLPALRGVAAVLLIASSIVQLVFARGVIPPLVAIDVALIAGWIVSRSRPKAGAITMGAASIAYLLGSGPFDAPNVAHPDSIFPFIVATAAMTAAVIGVIGFIAVLSGRMAGGGRTALAIGTAVVGVAVVIGVAAWTMADTTPTRAGDVAIKAHNVAYQPKVVQTPGGTVDIRVSNGDFVRHTFVLDGQHMSLSIPAGKARRTAVALQPGRYRFHCDIKGHENMAGTLVVS